MTRRLAGVLETSYSHFLALLLVGSAAWAWSRRFVLDDAFISFRYAANLAAGDGLVWNTGERVEGYTNFLWTVLLAIPRSLGIDLLLFCFLAGPLLSVATLWVTSRLAIDLLGSKPLALLVVALLGANPTFAAFATGGLETPLLALILTTMLWLVLRSRPRPEPALAPIAALSLLAAAALMTRLDAAVVVGPVMVVAAWAILKGSAGRLRGAAIALLVTPAAALVGAWFAWRFAYYGQWLPNSFAVRRLGTEVWSGGLTYLATFFSTYLLWPVVALFAAALWSRARRPSSGIATLLVVLVIEYAYVASVGGDFMEFRFLVPTLPILFVLIVWAAFRWIRQPLVGAALALLVVAGAVYHARTFVFRNGIESTWLLTAHLFDPASDWVGVGMTLGGTFRDAPDVRIGVTAAGAIPYYANLPAVDMLGINDSWVARHGLVFEGPPGHSRFAPVAYLVERGVNLVIGHPALVRPSPAERTAYTYDELLGLAIVSDPTPDALPAQATVLEVPLDPARAFLAVYLAPHPAVDAAIAARGWRRLRIDRGREGPG